MPIKKEEPVKPPKRRSTTVAAKESEVNKSTEKKKQTIRKSPKRGNSPPKDQAPNSPTVVPLQSQTSEQTAKPSVFMTQISLRSRQEGNPVTQIYPSNNTD